jgi:short-subunit dehydrogenase
MLVNENAALQIELVAGDVADDAVQQELVERALSRFGRLDVLVNNAGRGYYARFEDIDVAELTKLFALNVLAPLGLTQRALPALVASRGTVVMISSVAGVAVAPGMGAYAASKFALEALAAALRAEVATRGVRVVVVRPGPVATGFRDHAVSGGADALQTPTKDDRQKPANVARQVLAAVYARRDVVETSLYVRGVSFASRALPPVFRFVTKRMTK